MKSNEKVYRSFLKKHRSDTKDNLLVENDQNPLENSELKLTELETEFNRNKNETNELFIRTSKQFGLNENNILSRNHIPSSNFSSSLPNNGRQNLTISSSKNTIRREKYDMCREKSYTTRTEGKSSDNLNQRSGGTDEEIYLKNHLHLNLNLLKKELIEKTKTINFLEKQLNDKNLIISSLKSKLEKIGENNFKNSERIQMEKNIILQSDLANSMKIIKEKDDIINQNLKKYEEIFEEYRKKINGFISMNNNLLKKLKDLDSNYKIQKNSNENIQFEMLKKDEEIHRINIQLDSCRLELKTNQENIKKIVMMILNQSTFQNSFKDKNQNIIKKLKIILSDD